MKRARWIIAALGCALGVGAATPAAAQGTSGSGVEPEEAADVEVAELEDEQGNDDDDDDDDDGQFGDLELIGLGQLFVDYRATTSEVQNFNAFELRRAELGLGVVKDNAYGFMVNTEAIRSAGARSYFGVDNNSLVMRIKHGFGFVQPEVGPGQLTLRAGMIPDVWVELVEQAYDLRGIAPISAEQSRFYASSDLGGSIGYSAWDGLVEARVALTNGEGRNQVELNTGKNTTATVSVRPVRFEMFGERAVLGVHGSYRDGSVGVSSRPSHRISGALTFRHPRAFAGFEYGRATGYLGRGDLNAQLYGAWVSGSLYWRWLGGFGRWTMVDTDLEAEDAATMTTSAGLYADLIDAGDIPRAVLGFPRLRLYASWRNETFGEQAATVPGVVEATRANIFMVTVSARGSLAVDP